MIKAYEIKDLFRTLVIVSVNVTNHVILVNVNCANVMDPVILVSI